MKRKVFRWLTIALILLAGLVVFFACEPAQEDEGDPDDNVDTPKDTDNTDDHVHAYGDWQVVAEPTCTDAGSQRRVCACGEQETRSIAALGHDEQVVKAVSPGCVTSGLSEGLVCARCKRVLLAQNVVPDLGGHVYDGSNVCTRCHEEVVVPKGLQFEKLPDGTYELTKYTGTATDLVINRIYEGVLVTSIKEKAFYNNARLASVVLPDGLTTLKNSAFEGCTSLGNVSLPDTLTTLGDRAFYGCASMTSCAIPSLVGTVGAYAYANCTSITSAVVREGVREIGVGAFMRTNVSSLSLPTRSLLVLNNYAYKDCARLGNVTLPATLTTVGDMAFDGCSITKANIPAAACLAVSNAALLQADVSGAGVMPYGAFKNSPNLTTLVIARTITGVSGGALEGCAKLTQLSIPFVGSRLTTATDTWQYPFGYIFGTRSYDGSTSTTQYFYGESLSSVASETYYLPAGLTTVTVTNGNVPRGAFYNCNKLVNVTLPNSITRIGDYAFYRCERLTGVNLPNSLTSIGQNAFCGCNLNSISLSANMSALGNGAFRDCPIVTATSPAAFLGYIPKDRLVTVNVNNGDIVAANAFNGCSELQNVGFAASVAQIGANAFKDCEKLTTVNVANMDRWFYMIFDNEYANPMTYATVLTVGGTPVTEYAIPDGEASVHNRAFYNVTTLRKVTLPDSVTAIGSYAFYNCKSLTEINLTSSRVARIGAYAFGECSAMRTLSLPTSLRTLGTGAFSNCYGLTEAILQEGVQAETMTTEDGVWVAERFFDGCRKLVHLTNAAAEREDGTGIRITSSPAATGGEVVRSLDSAFRYEISRTDDGIVTFRIGNETDGKTYFLAYEGDSETVDLSATNVTDVYAYALYGNAFVKTVILHNRISSIGEMAFCGCSALTEIKVVEKDSTAADSTITVGFAAFEGTSITDASMPVSALGYLEVTTLERLTIVSGRVEAAMAISLGGVKHLTIGEDVSVVYEGAFVSAPNLETITVSEKNRNYVGVNDCLIGSTSKVLLLGTKNSVIPDDGSVTRIGDYAFASTGIASVVLSDRIASVGDYAFYNCASLTSVRFGNRISTVGNGAFGGCSSLTSVEIPSSVSSLGTDAFKNCSSLTSAVVGRGVASLAEGVFFGCGSLQSLTLPFVGATVGTGDAIRYPFAILFGRESTYGTFEGASLIKQSSFNVGTSLYREENYNLPDGLTTLIVNDGKIESGTFENCSTVTTMTVGDVDVAEYGFSGLSGLRSLTLSVGTITIGVRAFAGLTNLRSVSLPEGISSVGEGAFAGCSSLAIVNIPLSLKAIDDEAFRGCASLQRLTFARSGQSPAIERVGNYAFGESGLNYVSYDGTLAEWNAVEKAVHWAGDHYSFALHCTDVNNSYSH